MMDRADGEVESVQDRPLWLRWLRGALLLAVPIGLMGEAGHHLLDQLGYALAHHLFHILFGAGAVLVFALFVAAEVRRNGWPRFSWKLAERSATSEH